MTATAALLTPAGSGAIAVVRLSGMQNAAFAAKHLSRPPRLLRCVHCDLRDSAGETIDDIVVVETVDGQLDLNLHAGPWVVQATLRLAEENGYRIVPGPEAIDAGNEIERQVLLDLPRAKSKAVLRLLTAQPAAWATMLAAGNVAAMRLAIEDTALERALSTPTVAIVGPPNVGKSTLANALFARELSITADRPGTTRDWVGELADLDGLIVKLVDTPGVRETLDPIEAAAIGQANRVVTTADVVVVVIDGSRSIGGDERKLLDRWLSTPRQAVVRVRTKSDLPAASMTPADAVSVSAISGQGIMALRSMISKACGVDDLKTASARCWTNDQRYNLKRLMEA